MLPPPYWVIMGIVKLIFLIVIKGNNVVMITGNTP